MGFLKYILGFLVVVGLSNPTLSRHIFFSLNRRKGKNISSNRHRALSRAKRWIAALTCVGPSFKGLMYAISLKIKFK